ncbi:hypothetical protein SY88_18850 [Clostridiales bacterium PH28_bin88]|nr:hypothetical protein SY88_18850 [Clostridiales bacterium PH28_bin88]
MLKEAGKELYGATLLTLERAKSRYPELGIGTVPEYYFFDTKGEVFKTNEERKALEWTLCRKKRPDPAAFTRCQPPQTALMLLIKYIPRNKHQGYKRKQDYCSPKPAHAPLSGLPVRICKSYNDALCPLVPYAWARWSP